MSSLLGAVSILIQREHQLGIAQADQYAVPIQGVFADDVGETRRSLVFRIFANGFPDGVGQGLAGAARYVEV